MAHLAAGGTGDLRRAIAERLDGYLKLVSPPISDDNHTLEYRLRRAIQFQSIE